MRSEPEITENQHRTLFRLRRDGGRRVVWSIPLALTGKYVDLMVGDDLWLPVYLKDYKDGLDFEDEETANLYYSIYPKEKKQ